MRCCSSFRTAWLFISSIALVSAFAGCGENGPARTPDGGSSALCSAVAPTECPDPPPRYADVAPIFKAKCGPCHIAGVENGPWPLTEYESIVDWADIVRADVLSCAMPPADGGISISHEERQAILTWARCDFPK